MLNPKYRAYVFLFIAILNAIVQVYEKTSIWTCISAGCFLVLAIMQVAKYHKNKK